MTPNGNLSTFDFITVHQNQDLTVRFYETMDYGLMNNEGLDVKHKVSLYPPNTAGTIYFVNVIDNHARAPQCPCGEKRVALIFQGKRALALSRFWRFCM